MKDTISSWNYHSSSICKISSDIFTSLQVYSTIHMHYSVVV